MKISVDVTVPFENEIQFHDACQGVADVLLALGRKALQDGNAEQFENTTHEVVSANDDRLHIGDVEILGGE